MRNFDRSDGQFHRPSRGGEAPHFVSVLSLLPVAFVVACFLFVIPQRSGGICFLHST
jgi:hypothetical protein